MATQVVVFSVMLFGTSGVVLDFGRVYSEHSQMQSFTDQAALAAAAELDRKADSVDRAVASVFGTGSGSPMSKSAVFSSGNGNQFNISHLFFVRDLSDDDGPQYSLGSNLTGGNLLYTAFADGSSAGSEALASMHARYVIAVADERSVRNSLMQLINSNGNETVPETNPVRTTAAAKRQELTCGSFSNIVMCNPWEGQQTINYEEVASDPSFQGLQFSYVADGVLSGTPSVESGPLSAPNSLARRLALQGPAAVSDICNDPLTLPGFDPSASAAQNATARTICMLAAAQQQGATFCEADELKFTAAEPEVIATAMNTAFDMWDDPIAAVLDWDKDAAGRHSQDPAYAGASHPLRDDSPLFQPDLDVLKARYWHEPTAISNAALGIPASSRLNHLPMTNADNFKLTQLSCFRNAGNAAGEIDCYRDEDGNTVTHVADPARASIRAGQGLFSAYYRAIYNDPYLYENNDRALTLPTFYDVYLDQRAQWLNTETGINPPPFLAFLPPIPPGGSTVSLFHQATGTGLTLDPKAVREDGSLSRFIGGAPQIQMRPDYDDTTGAPLDADGNGTHDLTVAYPNYTYRDPSTNDVDPSIERRVFDVTLVNCGESSVDDDGDNVAPIAGYAQVVLMAPPQVSCADGTENCLNSNLTSTRLIMEFIGESAYTRTGYAVLVR